MNDDLLNKRFEIALAFIKGLPADGEIKPSISDQLKFYSLFKQASAGPCNEKQPSKLRMVQRAKWDAWNGLGKMSKQDAKAAYVTALLAMAKAMPASKERDGLLQQLEGGAQAKL
eukprot:TRINITY_DN4877_c0_g1_i1.p1 TRINITY_DN4877_c0_g1~~TRINITY_DN4877_c0_g1_i1.p1  ORF type:complete len:115 (-),score=20.50 TRINITY_DN4877_c0_g1_i1:55-399(-)